MEQGYEFKLQGDTEIYAKGGMYGQMLAFIPEQHLACAWHGYETEKNVRELFER